MEKTELIPAIVIITLLGMFTVVETGRYGSCRGGEWLPTDNPFEYQCSTNLDRVEICARLSGSRCYYGEVKKITPVQVPDNFDVVKDGIRYRCFEDKGYCLENADISKDHVSIGEVVG